jgi:hypothetical protein
MFSREMGWMILGGCMEYGTVTGSFRMFVGVISGGVRGNRTDGHVAESGW